MIEPHGGKLVKRFIEKPEKELKKVSISKELYQEVLNIAKGVFSPLEGFLNESEINSVINDMRLSDGTYWTIPIVFPINEETKKELLNQNEVYLEYEGKEFALLEIESIFKLKKDEIARKVYGTDDINHPGVKRTLEFDDFSIAGRVSVFDEPLKIYPEYNLTPEQTREEFKKRGWEKVVGFQTRNVPHLGHEFVQKAALTVMDGLFINPIIGKKKKGDFRDDVILKAYDALKKEYFPQDRVFLSILPTEMRYAGPKEAIHHAIMRKNFGCTHFIVGRDHAGVGNYYHPYAAHEIFEQFPDLGIEPVFFRAFFYCKKCRSIASDKTCPHSEENHINFSGTKIRGLLSEGKMPPEDLMRPEVSEVILSFDNPFVE